MHQARALRATIQDVCIFCAIRSASARSTVTSRRRCLGTSSSSRRQNAGVAFKDDDEDAGFGGLADAVEATNPPPPQPTPNPNLSQRPQPAIRYERATGRAAHVQSGRGQSHRDWPGHQDSTPRFARIRRINDVRSLGSLQESSVDTAKWTIGRRAPATPQTSSTENTLAEFSPPQAAERSAQSRPQSRLPRSDGTRIRSQASRAGDTYVPFDARLRNVRLARQLGSSTTESPPSVQAPPNHAPLPQEPVRWQPTTPLVNLQSEPEPPHDTLARQANGSEGPRISRVAVDSSFSPNVPSTLAQEQQFDEYGFPIEGAASTASFGSPPRHHFDEYGFPIGGDEIRLRSKSRSRVNLVTEHAKSEQDLLQSRPERIMRRKGKPERDEDDTRRRKDTKKNGRTSSRDDVDDFDLEDYHRRKRERQAARIVAKESSKAKEDRRVIRLPDFIKVGSLATELQLRYGRFAQILEKYGFEDVNSDYVLSADNAALIAEEAGFNAITESSGQDEDLYAAALPEDMSSLPQRPPVVTIMGHVDHGKTTILDYMRKSSIVASEHGGITQHIGAFSVPMPSGKTITFLDTPGHAAFLSMRQRGANVTDIVVLVVAADDSVMPQTVEALKHAKAAQVPIIVAMNKIDKPEAKPDQVMQDLARNGVDVEDYGGDVQVVQVSGKTGQGMPDLEEAIIALSEIQDQRAPVDGSVEGWVLESSTKEVGKVATVLIRRGTLRPGDIIVAGTEYCRVRTMRDEFGNQIPQTGPGMPAEIDGWRGQPKAGDEVLQAPNEQVAHHITHLREAKLKRVDLTKDVDAINEHRKAHQQKHEREKAIARARKEGIVLPDDTTQDHVNDPSSVKHVYFIVKGDVAGSVEAVVNSIASLGNSEVRPVVLKAAVGSITESDVDHATAAGGQVISFNTSIPPTIRAMAERAGTKILNHNIIYRLVDEVKVSLEEVLPPIVKSKVLGEAEISQIFEINQKRKKLKIAGCKVRNGTIMRNAKVKVMRGLDNAVVYTGTFSSLKNVKKDVMEMGKGSECGMGFTDWQDFQPGDITQCYEEWEEKRKM